MFTRKSDAQQFYATVRAGATDTVAVAAASSTATPATAFSSSLPTKAAASYLDGRDFGGVSNGSAWPANDTSAGAEEPVSAYEAAPFPATGATDPFTAATPSTMPGKASDESIIGPDLKITGNVISRGRVRLEGVIEGDMRCSSLVVSQSGTITGGIVASEVAVYGRVAGTIKGQRVNLYASAHVEGDITHQGIGVEMGTHYDGRLRWSAHPLDDGTDATSDASPSDRQRR
jgi:cytoskeletal protein CcmA (bactofilin family)